MTDSITPLALVAPAVGVFVALWWLFGSALGLGYPWLRRRLVDQPASLRCKLLLALGLLPTALAMIMSLSLFLPGIGAALVSEHCHGDLGCSPHAPVLDHSLLQISNLVLVLVLGVAILLRVTAPARRHRRQLLRLSALSHRPPGGDHHLIDCEPPLALTVGLWSPEVFLSRGLVQRLPPEQLNALLAHERAHARRRDALWAAVAEVALPTLPAKLDRLLLADLRQAQEQCCDFEAAGTDQGSLDLAQALITAQRAAQGDSGNPSDLPQRIRALLTTPASPPRYHLLLPALACLLLLTLTLKGVDPAHHGIEWLAAWLLR